MSDDEENIITFGTPLPEIEDEATLKKKAAKELQVRDEKGRQRFHGAFTGGFSAGYFNTVGTKEGWAPSSFVSSRDKKSDGIQQNPEDFMDDEDFGEFGIATRRIHTTTNFQDLSGRNDQKRKFIDSDSIIPGEAPLKNLVQPVRESIGIIILKKLGWREGQGIGPRVKKGPKGPKIYGCSPFPDKDAPEEDDPTTALFTFAPEDTESTSYKSKDDYFGLGYTGLSKQSVLNAPTDPFAPTSTKSWLVKDKRKLQISGQAFGVGAFEDDDEDIYGKDDMSQYDFSDLEVKKLEDSHKAIETSKHAKSQGVLDGFHLAKQPPLVKEYYPPPTLPPNFIPHHLKIICFAHQKTNISQSRHNLSASDRSLILGEKKFGKVPVNDLPEVRKKIDQTQPQMPSTSSSSSFFRPFSNDIAKQQRYEDYLKLRQTGDVSKFVHPSSMTEWEKQQEIEEFSKAAVLYSKPLSNALSSRFESRSNLSAEQEVMAALEKIKKEKEGKQAIAKKCLVGKSNRGTFEWHPVSLLCKRMNVPNPYPNSDSSGTGKKSHSKSVFSHLNFGFENLESSSKPDCSLPTESSSSAVKTTEPNKVLPDEIQNQNVDSTASNQNNQKAISAKKVKVPLFEGKRPPMDFFKDIFENSSSDEDEEDEERPKESDGNNSSKRITPESKNEEENLKNDSNSSDKKATITVDKEEGHNATVTEKSSGKKKVGFGVFANLDLDALNERPAAKPFCPEVSGSKDKIVEKTAVNSNTDVHIDTHPKVDDKYGPELPPNFSAASPVPLPVSISSDGSSRKHSKSKSKHKHKHHKHKHKKKKKKSSKRDSSSSDSSVEELDDIPPSLIIEKMKKLQKKKH